MPFTRQLHVLSRGRQPTKRRLAEVTVRFVEYFIVSVHSLPAAAQVFYEPPSRRTAKNAVSYSDSRSRIQCCVALMWCRVLPSNQFLTLWFLRIRRGFTLPVGFTVLGPCMVFRNSCLSFNPTSTIVAPRMGSGLTLHARTRGPSEPNLSMWAGETSPALLRTRLTNVRIGPSTAVEQPRRQTLVMAVHRLPSAGYTNTQGDRWPGSSLSNFDSPHNL